MVQQRRFLSHNRCGLTIVYSRKPLVILRIIRLADAIGLRFKTEFFTSNARKYMLQQRTDIMEIRFAGIKFRPFLRCMHGYGLSLWPLDALMWRNRCSNGSSG